ncbi:MAG: hypothetical protein NZL87_01965 [Thermomicrobium sp.]|nr:hypothetical protein [Thermomicrobium sp.]
MGTIAVARALIEHLAFGSLVFLPERSPDATHARVSEIIFSILDLIAVGNPSSVQGDGLGVIHSYGTDATIDRSAALTEDAGCCT